MGIQAFLGGGGLGFGVRLLWTTGSTVILFGVATVIGAGVVEQQAEFLRLRRASVRILLLKSESRRFAEDQHRLLADALGTSVIPDLEHLAEEAEELAQTSHSDLEPLQARVAFYSETIIRSLSRAVSDIVPRRLSPDPATEPAAQFRMRELLDLLMSARVRVLPSAVLMAVLIWAQFVPSCLPRDALILVCGVLVMVLVHFVGRLVPGGWARVSGLVNLLFYPAVAAALMWSARSPIVACGWEGSNRELLDQRRLLERVTDLLELALADVQSVLADEMPEVSIDARIEAMRGQWAGLLEVTWGCLPGRPRFSEPSQGAPRGCTRSWARRSPMPAATAGHPPSTCASTSTARPGPALSSVPPTTALDRLPRFARASAPSA